MFKNSSTGLKNGTSFCRRCSNRPTGSSRGAALQGKSHLVIPFMGIVRPQSQFPHPGVCERFMYSQDRSTYFPAAESWKYINLSEIYECRNWETEHYNHVLEIKVSFLGIHEREPDICIGFSPALHLQCRSRCLQNCF
jgi:hypothetical protein